MVPGKSKECSQRLQALVLNLLVLVGWSARALERIEAIELGEPLGETTSIWVAGKQRGLHLAREPSGREKTRGRSGRMREQRVRARPAVVL